VSSELEGIRGKSVVTYSEVPSWHLSGWTRGSHKNSCGWIAVAMADNRTHHRLNTSHKRYRLVSLCSVLLIIRSRDSNRLWPGRQEFDSRQGQVFLFSTTTRPAFGHTQLYIQWVPGPLSSGTEAAGAWSWSLTSIYGRRQEWWSCTSTPPLLFSALCSVVVEIVILLIHTFLSGHVCYNPHPSHPSLLITVVVLVNNE
jgi:hypothetical protein